TVLARVSAATEQRKSELAKEQLATLEACVDNEVKYARDLVRKADRIHAKPRDVAKSARDLATVSADMTKRIAEAERCAKEATNGAGNDSLARSLGTRVASLIADRDRIAA